MTMPIDGGGGGGNPVTGEGAGWVPSQELLKTWMSQRPAWFYEKFPMGIPGVTDDQAFQPGMNFMQLRQKYGAMTPGEGGPGGWTPGLPGQGGGGGRGGLLDELLRGAGGGGGGGGGGISRFLQEHLTNYNTALGNDPLSSLLPQVLSDAQDTSVLSADPRWQEGLFALQQELQQRGGRLADLDPETAAQLDAMMAAERGAVEGQIRDANEQVLARAFGSGLQQSTVLGDATSRVAGQSAELMRNVVASDAGRRLNLRTELADQYLRSADLRRATLDSGGSMNLQDIGLQADQISDQRNRRASLLEGSMNRALEQVQMARSAQEFSRDLGLRRWQTQVDAELQRRGLGLQRQELLYKDKWFGLEQAFREREFQEGIRQYNLGYGLDRDALERGIYENNRARSDANRNAWLSTAAVLISAFSDGRLKEDVAPIASREALAKVLKLRPVTWLWREDVPYLGSTAGFVAQDVAKVLPRVVHEAPVGGMLTVDYGAVTPYLVAAVQQLVARIVALEERLQEVA